MNVKNILEFANNKCSEHLSHRLSVTCNYCGNNFRTTCISDVRCSACSAYCCSIERKLKTYTLEDLKK